MSVGRVSRFPRALLIPDISRAWLLRAALLFAGYSVCGRAGLLMPSIGALDPSTWLPAGVALAGLLRFGVGVWPAVFFGALGLTLAAGFEPWLALMIATGNTLGPALGALVLQREGLHTELDRRRDLWLFGVAGIGFAMAVSAGNASFWLAASGRLGGPQAFQVWREIWLGEALSALLIGIPLLTCSRASVQQAGAAWRWLPSALLALGVIGSGALLLALANPAGAAPAAWFFVPLGLLPHALLGWMAARSGLFAASLSALALAAVALIAAPTGIGPFTWAGRDHGMALLLVWIGSLPLGPLLLTALTGEIAANERRWRLALDGAQIGIGEWDLLRGRFDMSARWLAVLGYTPAEFGHDLAAFWSRVHPDDVLAVRRAFEPLRAARHADPETGCRATCRMLCRDLSWRTFDLHALVIDRGPDAAPQRLITTARDTTELESARDGQHLSRNVFEYLHEGLLITDSNHRVLEANPTFEQITGDSRAALLATVPPLLRPAEPGSEAAVWQAAMHAALASHGVWRGEVREHRRDGAPCLLQITVSLVRDADAAVRKHVFAITDITHARQQLEQLQRQAHFDELTRLPNRVRMSHMLEAALQTSRREGSLLTVCYLDLDHFKPVNDRFGHEAGDRLLLELANRMRRSLRSWAGGDDVVARIGGDEFVLLLRTTTLEESRHAVERVLNQVCQPYALGLGGGPVMVTASIGATVFPLDGADAETLLRHADHAMYGAKQAGRNGYLFFDAEHDRRAEARFVALGRVQEALDADEFRLYYQPKVDMHSGAVLGVEALLRWKHPDKGVISPAQFLPLIENTGLSSSVGNWVLQQGIDQLAQWLSQGLDLTVSINISARHLQEPLFAQHLAGLLARQHAPVAEHLIIEVLETAALADVDYTCALMVECRALGVRFALDDFGTGYSTFTYLKRLPIDMLKIDRSFITHMLSDRHDLAIVEGVIGLSQTFGCTVVAEGVETAEQAQRLIEIGCTMGQGNGIAAAMPADQVPGWVGSYAGMPGSLGLRAR